MRSNCFFYLLVSCFQLTVSSQVPEYSAAGFFSVPESGREVMDFNIGWRFFKGEASQAERNDFDDSNWPIVNTPHGLELIPTQSSGSNNYRGEAWYRKHFRVPRHLEQKRQILYFEAVMGKCKVWLNGELLYTHFGGYLPFSVDLTGKIKNGRENIIGVWADNSDDPSFPPGKPQAHLDFNYFGGIYRDVWLVTTNDIYITDANQSNQIAGGGLLIHYNDLSSEQVKIVVQAEVANDRHSDQEIQLTYLLKTKEGELVSETAAQAILEANQSKTVEHTIELQKPMLWSPKSPYLYQLEVQISQNDQPLDAVRQKLGIRKIEFKGKEGFFLNNEAYQGKLMGVNRHQDFAYLGNALPNSGQWRDAIILKEAGCEMVRAAHYPADPAFMDACDELGLFFIVATPGWQFWNNNDPSFETLVYEDIRNMVRRDRNHPSVLMWEPILNETYYPDDFAKNTHDLVHQELPFGTYTVCDYAAKGQEHFDLIYSHPYRDDFYNYPVPNTEANRKEWQFDYDKENRSVFTREWGDSVDDWSSHNSPSRAARNWGENAQLIQANHYAKPSFVYTSLESLQDTPPQHVGGALWHAFDHQRGYHPDPFYGGLTDVFRQPKYSYNLFKTQQHIEDSEPMIYIANEMTPFSPADVTVFSNCEEIRLIVFEKDSMTYKSQSKMLGPMAVFKNAFDFIEIKSLYRQDLPLQANMVAEGLVNGKVVVRTQKFPALRPSFVQLELANKGIPLVANGSDVVTVIASVVDQNGRVKRLNNDYIRFEIEGEGEIIDDGTIMANPVKTEWGTAPVLIRSSNKVGKIVVKAYVLGEGSNRPQHGELIFWSESSPIALLYGEEPTRELSGVDKTTKEDKSKQQLNRKILELEHELNKLKLKEIEKQQEDFEGGNKKN
jgi:beta-galactosidase